MVDDTDGTDDPVLTVLENTEKRRFEIHVDGQLAAFTNYHVEGAGTYAFTHTETVPAFAGHGIGSLLIEQVLDQMRAAGHTVLPYCPFVNAYIRKHPQYADLVPAADRHRFGVGE